MLRLFLYFATLLPGQAWKLYYHQPQIYEPITIRQIEQKAALNYSCPVGINLIRDGECRGWIGEFGDRPEVIVETANKKCNEIGGKMVVVHNEENQLYWNAPRIEHHYQEILLGLVCNRAWSRWVWVDGSPVDYKPQNYDDALDKACDEKCAWILLRPSGRWAMQCSERRYLYGDLYCTAELPPPPVPSLDGCEDFEVENEDGICYQVFPTGLNSHYAQQLCRSVGATQASIHNQKENAFVRDLAVSNGAVNGVSLGASRTGEGKEFEWIDESQFDYRNFYPGFPHRGFGNCLVMDVPTGQWMNMDCDSDMPVACIRKKRSLPTPSCSTEVYEGAGMISSPGYPFSASMPCDYFLKVDAGRKVVAEIIALEANSCCDYLTLYDGYVSGKVIANLTDVVRHKTFMTTSTNFMRVSWKPNGGVNVRGLSMTFRST